jgi:hypothetical protein
VRNFLCYTTYEDTTYEDTISLSFHDVCVIYRRFDDPHHKLLWVCRYARCFLNAGGIVRDLLSDSRVDPSFRDHYALITASEFGYRELVEILLSHPKVDPTTKDNSAIRSACENGHIDTVKLLWTHPGVRASVDGYKIIDSVCGRGHVSVVEFLIRNLGVDPAANDNLALRRASKGGHAPKV